MGRYALKYNEEFLVADELGDVTGGLIGGCHAAIRTGVEIRGQVTKARRLAVERVDHNSLD